MAQSIRQMEYIIIIIDISCPFKCSHEAPSHPFVQSETCRPVQNMSRNPLIGRELNIFQFDSGDWPDLGSWVVS